MEVVKIEDKELQVKEWNGKRVVTFKEIDELHKRPSGTAKRNFNENESKFMQNEDFLEITRDEFGTNFAPKEKIVGNPKLKTMLITESGYLILVKSLTDDLAWKVQRQLVNSYFKAKEKTDLSLDKDFARMEKYEDGYYSGEIDLKKFSELRKSVNSRLRIKVQLAKIVKEKCEPTESSSTSTSSSQKLPAPSCIDNPKFLETLMFLAETEERFSPSRCYELFCNKVPGLKKEFGTSNVMSQKLKAGLVDKFGVVFSSERRSLGRLWAFRKINVDADEV